MKKAIVFGAGISGLGAQKLLIKYDYQVYLVDDKIGITSKEAEIYLQNEEIECIIKSPGIKWDVPLLLLAKEKNIPIISEIDLAVKYMNSDIKVIAITGTNGKTTTATKIYELLKMAKYNVYLAGNAGFSFAGLIADDIIFDYVVLELSSYQLENNPQIHPYIAGIINLTPDHLTRYETVDEYYKTKFNIFSKQNEHDYALINLDDPVFDVIKKQYLLDDIIKGTPIYLSKFLQGQIFVYDKYIYMMKDITKDIREFIHNSEFEQYNRIILSVADKIIHIHDLTLKGDHNLENILFILGVSKILSIDISVIQTFLASTRALEHRLENFLQKENVLFINDSKGTNVESTIKAIEAFPQKIVLICGGEDKKISNTELIKKISERVDFVYLIGENAILLEEELCQYNYTKYKNLHTIENVLEDIRKNIDFKETQVVLFSPATSSFDQFKNFEERGKIFKQKTIQIIGEK